MERLPVELTVVRSQPGPVSDGQWSTGLCECYGDMSDCCFALWCLPVFACKTSRAAGGCVCLPLLDCVSCVPPASLAMRAAVRERYGIEGSVYSDCFYGCCCYPLSWCQISREIKRRAAALSNAQTSSYSSSSSKRWHVPLFHLSNAHLV
ncbi:cornifelin homolog B-like isoform X2 [Hemibagrus wyckioides]|uniref:cornifelin homolog B-like isoform X2 n=1 Tax=Hemibagrus wyckioides TaxID=337641 RepID=UPI00266D9A11|nr:cornifelin homolog B-like isoform X2 [Hemibagrus wyckioides]